MTEGRKGTHDYLVRIKSPSSLCNNPFPSQEELPISLESTFANILFVFSFVYTHTHTHTQSRSFYCGTVG